MDGNVLPSKLLSRLSSAVEIIRRHDFIQVYSHNDADGLASAGIIANALAREGKEFRITIFKILSEETMQTVRSCNSDCILISDLGASYIKELEALGKDVVVLDHHTVIDDSDKICYVNPHLFGIDGMTEGCGSTLSLLFSVQMNERNWDLVQIAMGGIAGDRQHIRGMLGLNDYLLKEGTERGFVSVGDGSLIPTGPLSRSLYLSTDPYVRGVSGNQESVMKILSEARISPDKSFSDLTDDERRRLSSMLAIKLTVQGVSQQTMTEVSRVRYFLRDWKMDAETMSDLLNACGRLEVQGIGIAMCLGSRDDLLRAIELNNEYKNDVLESVTGLEKNGLKQMEHIQYFNAPAGYSGVTCGIAMQFIGDHDKPTIAINASDDITKISSRGMWCQLDKGVDLAAAMRDAAKSVGGEGGGHKIASGASFKPGNEELFLKNLDTIIGQQLSCAK